MEKIDKKSINVFITTDTYSKQKVFSVYKRNISAFL